MSDYRALAERLKVARYGEPLMQRWDEWRLRHHQGYSGSITRDEFESIIDGIDEERAEAASAILALLEQRDSFKEWNAGWKEKTFQNLDRATLAEARLAKATDALREIDGHLTNLQPKLVNGPMALNKDQLAMVDRYVGPAIDSARTVL